MPKSMKYIYLDYAASATPNPSSIHEIGISAKRKLEKARHEVATILGARAEEIIFTSGGTESNNLAIQGVVLASQMQKNFTQLPHIITTNIEHPSVLETYKLLEKRKLAEITIVPVEENGIVDSKKIKKAIKKNTVLVSVMYANNEIGTIQPIKEIAKEIRHYKKTNNRNNIYFHTDAVQAVNYLDLNIEKLGVDMLSLSGSKISGSGRVGVLLKKKSVEIQNIFGGGDQERGLRPGTENLKAILEFASALSVAQKVREKEARRVIKLRDYFFRTLDVRISDVGRPKFIINGDLENRLPNNMSVTFPKIPSDLLVIELSAKGIMASSKSACKSSRAEGSYVIKAIRPDADPEIGALRFSLGADTKKQDIDYVIKALGQILQKLKKWYAPTPISKLEIK
ncbi:MAG: cysteine desulfurase family protein [Candidatus Paceibacterota bacterium]|jgi:cysteine desulfurase